MHYGKTLIVTLIAALTLASSQMANAQAVIFEQPQPSGPSWSTILGAVGAAGGAVAGYNAGGYGTGSQGGNTAIGAVLGGLTGLFIGSLIDNNRASVVGFSRGISAENLVCVRLSTGQCYCWDKTSKKSQSGSSSSSGKTSLTDEQTADANAAIKNAYRSSRCNHDRVEYYDAIKRMRFAYENESCQTYGDDLGQTTEAEAINMCLKESTTCNKLK